MSVNKVILIGRAGKDAEKVSEIVSKFSLATSERYTNKQGEQVENTEWHNIVMFNKLAESLTNYITKGKQLFVEGRIQYSEYQNANGEKRMGVQIIASKITLLGGSSEKPTQQKNEWKANKPVSLQSNNDDKFIQPPNDLLTGDLPF